MMKNSLVRHHDCTRCKLFVLVDRMRIAYLDCFSGISGDMFLGALIDAGVPAKLFEDTVTALNIGDSLHVRDIRPGDFEVLSDPDASIALVSAPTAIEEPAADAAATAVAAAEPEVIAKGKKDEEGEGKDKEKDKGKDKGKGKEK